MTKIYLKYAKVWFTTALVWYIFSIPPWIIVSAGNFDFLITLTIPIVIGTLSLFFAVAYLVLAVVDGED
jgi:hypothetical protein